MNDAKKKDTGHLYPGSGLNPGPPASNVATPTAEAKPAAPAKPKRKTDPAIRLLARIDGLLATEDAAVAEQVLTWLNAKYFARKPPEVKT